MAAVALLDHVPDPTPDDIDTAMALKQLAAAELWAAWDAVEVALHATGRTRVKATLGSESVMPFAEPLAQGCAVLRDALAAGQSVGQVSYRPFNSSLIRSGCTVPDSRAR